MRDPVTLEGTRVRLGPLGLQHADGRWHAGRFAEKITYDPTADGCATRVVVTPRFTG